MIALRWIVRPTDKTIMNEHGWYELETEKVLQYCNEDFIESQIWFDVPTVEEE